jgi:hypothetical protein
VRPDTRCRWQEGVHDGNTLDVSRRGSAIGLGIVLAFAATPARADEGRLLGDDTFAVGPHGTLLLDGGLFAGTPAALPAGISTGVIAGVTRECGCRFSYGARASWSRETASSMTWVVAQQDVRLRAIGAVRHAFGRGTLALRLGAGTNVVYERRDRQQASRLPGGDAFASRSLAALPAADLAGVVELHVTGPWLLVASGGPTADVLDGNLRGGWVAQLGIGWQP